MLESDGGNGFIGKVKVWFNGGFIVGVVFIIFLNGRFYYLFGGRSLWLVY